MTYSKFKDIIKIINEESPIRNMGNTNLGFKEKCENDLRNLKKIESEMDIIYNKINSPLKVVLMGEVKSGKSTIVNSIVGEQVSYVDVVEATASIIEIQHGFKEEAIIEKFNGENIIGTVDEINSILEKNIKDQDFFKNIKLIKIKKNIQNLNELSIVDTPGLETITTENENRTTDYLQEADFVIWVINCNHLGQSDVIEKMEEVYDLGKPIICIANRIDEVDAEPEEVIEYLEDELGYMIINAIPMSGKMAYQGVVNNDKKLLQKSGYNLLMSTIEGMNLNHEKIQDESVLNSFNVQVNRDINIHNKMKLYVEEINKDLKQRFENLEKYKDKLNRDIENKAGRWFEDELLVSEIDEILDSKSDVKLKKYFSEKYIEDQINKFMEDLEKDISKKWERFSNNEIMEHIKNIELAEEKIEILYANDSSLLDCTNNYNSDEIIEEAKKGAKLGGKIGAVVAGYAAWLGPAAANITILGSLGAVLPPFIIGGALLKGYKYFKEKGNKADKLEEVRDNLLKTKDNLKRTYFDDIVKSAKVMNENILNNVKVNIESLVLNPFKEIGVMNLDEFIFDIDKYINLISKLNQKTDKVWVIDTNVFIDEPNILDSFDDDETVVISKQVLIELDNKKRDLQLRRNVQKALDSINKNNIIFDDIDKSFISSIYSDDDCPDNYILNTAVKYKSMNVVLITSDKNLIAKCKAENINSMSLQEFQELDKYVRVLE